MRPWILRIPLYGQYESLSIELTAEDARCYRSFQKMTRDVSRNSCQRGILRSHEISTPGWSRDYPVSTHTARPGIFVVEELRLPAALGINTDRFLPEAPRQKLSMINILRSEVGYWL